MMWCDAIVLRFCDSSHDNLYLYVETVYIFIAKVIACGIFRVLRLCRLAFPRKLIKICGDHKSPKSQWKFRKSKSQPEKCFTLTLNLYVINRMIIQGFHQLTFSANCFRPFLRSEKVRYYLKYFQGARVGS